MNEQTLDADRTTDAAATADAEDLATGCGETRNNTEERQKKSWLVGTATLAKSNAQFPSPTKPVRCLPAELSQGQKEALEVVTLNADVLRRETHTLRWTVKRHCPPKGRPGRGGQWPVAGGGQNLNVVHRELSYHIAAFSDSRNFHKLKTKRLSMEEGET